MNGFINKLLRLNSMVIMDKRTKYDCISIDTDFNIVPGVYDHELLDDNPNVIHTNSKTGLWTYDRADGVVIWVPTSKHADLYVINTFIDDMKVRLMYHGILSGGDYQIKLV